MATLIDRNGLRPDTWHGFDGDAGSLPPDADALIPLDEWLERAASPDDRLTSRRLRVSIVRGEVVPAERLAAPQAEQGVLTHIPSINRLSAWWNTIGGADWLTTRSTQQVSAILRDFQPVTSIIETLKTHLQFKQ
jgi:hypothetical protein